MSWSTISNEQGPIVQNKTGSAAGQFPNIFRRYHQPTGRFVVAEEDGAKAAQVGDTRRFVNVWDMDAVGNIKTPVPANGWQTGVLHRSGQPVFVLTSLGPVLDPSDPSTWRPGL